MVSFFLSPSGLKIMVGSSERALAWGFVLSTTTVGS
jgi:hypothetical protein